MTKPLSLDDILYEIKLRIDKIDKAIEENPGLHDEVSLESRKVELRRLYSWIESWKGEGVGV